MNNWQVTWIFKALILILRWILWHDEVDTHRSDSFYSGHPSPMSENHKEWRTKMNEHIEDGIEEIHRDDKI